LQGSGKLINVKFDLKGRFNINITSEGWGVVAILSGYACHLSKTRNCIILRQ